MTTESSAGLPDKRQAEQKRIILEQLRKMPIVQAVCEKVGVSRATFYRWLKEDEEFAKLAGEATTDGTGLVNDLAENQLISLIHARNLGAVTYWLKHRHAAYRNKLEVQANLRHEDAPLTPEQEAVIEKALKLFSEED